MVSLGNRQALGLGKKLSIGVNIKLKSHYDMAFSDASMVAWGVGIYSNNLAYSFKYRFNDSQLHWHINIKELFAEMCSLLIYIIIRSVCKNVGNTGATSVALLIDNSCAQSICASKKVSLKSIELAILAKIIHASQDTFGVEWHVKRIESAQNVWADRLSRSDVLNSPAFFYTIFSHLLFGVLKLDQTPEDYVLKVLLKYGKAATNMSVTEKK